MKLAVFSDLHTELWRVDLQRAIIQASADVLVLAGDIGTLQPQRLKETADFFDHVSGAFKHTIYVLGNHEYYGLHPMLVEENVADLKRAVPKLNIIDTPRMLEIEGQRFVCGTMWFPRRKTNLKISDHKCIRGFLPWVWRQYDDFKKLAVQELRSTDVVITHHTPSEQSVPEKFAGDPYNQFFCVPSMEVLIKERQPKLWIHGHTHDSFDYRIGETRIVCNPLGYRSEPQQFIFDPFKVVEV